MSEQPKLETSWQHFVSYQFYKGVPSQEQIAYVAFKAGAATMAELVATTGTRSRIERLLCAMLSNPTQFSLHGKTYADAAIELDSILTEHEKQFP